MLKSIDTDVRRHRERRAAMDEQMVEKRYSESDQYANAVKRGVRLGKRLQRLAGLLQYAKVGVVRYRLRPS